MKIAIKANPNRGEEIISLLKSLGGINPKDWKGDGQIDTYYMDKNNIIRYDKTPIDYKPYTLEEFEKEFPFKIGDIVLLKGVNKPYEIIALEWYMDKLCYKLDNGLHFNPDTLTTYKKMKEERNVVLTLDKAKEWYKKGGELKEIALQAFTEKELTKVDLPKTWEEFCGNYPIKEGESYAGDSSEIYTHCKSNGERDSELDRNMCPTPKSAEAHLAMIQLEQLRNCWWNGWKPIWDMSHKWCIHLWGNELSVGITTNVSMFLTFPTREMAEEFLKCFRDLIEQAGDLI